MAPTSFCVRFLISISIISYHIIPHHIISHHIISYHIRFLQSGDKVENNSSLVACYHAWVMFLQLSTISMFSYPLLFKTKELSIWVIFNFITWITEDKRTLIQCWIEEKQPKPCSMTVSIIISLWSTKHHRSAPSARTLKGQGGSQTIAA